MGGNASKLDGMDWAKADGGITSPEGTIVDGNAPTDAYHDIYIEKKTVVGNESEYTIKDSEEKILYETVHNSDAKTREQFDLVDVNDAENDKDKNVLVQVYHRPTNNDIWDIYWVNKPTYEGQKSEEAISKTKDVERYKRACIVLNEDRSGANVHLYGPPEDKTGDAILRLERVKPVEGLVSFLGKIVAGGGVEEYQTILPDGSNANAQPLVGSWKWENIPLISHQIHLMISKGADLPLHAVLAIVCNIMRVDKWTGDD